MKSGRDLAVIASFSSDTGIDRCATFKRVSGNWRIDQAAWGHPAILARNWLAPPKRVRTHAQTQARKTGVLGGQLFRGFIVNQLRFAVCRSKTTGLQI